MWSKPLPTAIVAGLRSIDPERNAAQLSPHEIDTAREALLANELTTSGIDLLTVERTAPPGSHHRRRTSWPLALVVVTAAAVVGGWFMFDGQPRHNAATAPVGAAYVKDVPSAYRAIAAQLAPLAAGMSVACTGDVHVPVPMLAAPGDAESGTSPASAALRDVLAHNPWAGTSDLSRGNWLLLADTGDKAVFGQREGTLGIGSVITFSRSGSSYRPENLGGCGPVIPGPGQIGEPIYGATVAGSSLDLAWTTGSNCGNGPAKTDRVLDHVVVQETPTTVRLLIISKPAPDAGPVRGPCGGTAKGATAHVRLAEPLGTRTLLDDAHVPPTRVAR